MIKWIFIIVAANALIDGALAVACLTSGRLREHDEPN